MARPIPEKRKTVKVQSTVNILGLTPGQIVEIDDTQQVRDLVGAGLLVLVMTKAEFAKHSAPAPAPAPVVEDITEDED